MTDSIERIADEMDEATAAYASSCTYRRLATRLRALSPAGGDWVMVPREPTPEMLKSLFSGAHSYDYREGNDYRREELDDYYLSMYRNLLAASPQQEPGAGPTMCECGEPERGGHAVWCPMSGAVPFDVLSIASEMEAACPHYAGPDVDYSVDASKVHTWAQALRATQPAATGEKCAEHKTPADEPSGQTLAGAELTIAEYLDELATDPDPLDELDRRYIAEAAATIRRTATSAGTTGDDSEDAARYRWLRTQDWFNGPLCVLRDPKKVLTSGSGLGADCPSRDRLDEAIDAARRARTGDSQ